MSIVTTDPSQRESTPSVTVRGEAVLRAEPDEAMLWVTLSALEDDPGKALADVSRRSDALVAILDDLGVAAKDRSTTSDHFPWFKQAAVDAILSLERPAPQHLRWPDLDVDLAVDSIEHPERYPLKSKL